MQAHSIWQVSVTLEDGFCLDPAFLGGTTAALSVDQDHYGERMVISTKAINVLTECECNSYL